MSLHKTPGAKRRAAGLASVNDPRPAAWTPWRTVRWVCPLRWLGWARLASLWLWVFASGLCAAGAAAAQPALDEHLERLLGGTVGEAPAQRMDVVGALQQLGQPERAVALRRYLLAAHVARLDGQAYDASTTLAQAIAAGAHEAEPAPGTPVAVAWERAFDKHMAVLYRFVDGERPPPEVQALSGPVQPWSPGLWGVGSADPWLYIARLHFQNNTGAAWPLGQVNMRIGPWTLECRPGAQQPPEPQTATVLKPGDVRAYLCQALGGKDLRVALQKELESLYMGSQGTRPAMLRLAPTDFNSPESVARWVTALSREREAETEALVRGVLAQRQLGIEQAERARLNALAKAKKWKQQAFAWGCVGAALWALQGCLRGRRKGMLWDEILVRVGLPAGGAVLVAGLVGTTWGYLAVTWAVQQWGAQVSPVLTLTTGPLAGAGRGLDQRPGLLFVLLTLAVYAFGRALYAIGAPSLMVRAATLASMVGAGVVVLRSFTGLSQLSGSLPGLVAMVVVVTTVLVVCLAAGLIAIKLHTLHNTLAGVGSGLLRNFFGAFRRSLDFRSTATAAELWAYLIVYFAVTLVMLEVAAPLGWATAALLGVPAVALIKRRLNLLSTLELLFIAAGILIIALDIAHGL